jgi:hypothetical protein
MEFQLIKELDLAINQHTFILEDLQAEGIIDDKGEILEEGTFKFFAWAKNLLDRTTISDDQIERDPTVDAAEADPVDVKDAADAKAKLAKILAGLKFYAKKGDAELKKLFLSNDSAVEANIKHHAAKKDIDMILMDFKTRSRNYIKKLLKDMEEFYRVKGYGVK